MQPYLPSAWICHSLQCVVWSLGYLSVNMSLCAAWSWNFSSVSPDETLIRLSWICLYSVKKPDSVAWSLVPRLVHSSSIFGYPLIHRWLTGNRLPPSCHINLLIFERVLLAETC
ncbi:hypothetical protein IW261DRAFT_834472 [Armillaria novae-zelandiae]|uniref:Uncharacterized protein n=1 Tax=Armillaria novae-zelandiae TaxID=153914 RepID=A0AA39NTG4_9AGAR|nr:hypothetical protein IW261DRAFT_834472 [Armillaria novae-zelandiae]